MTPIVLRGPGGTARLIPAGDQRWTVTVEPDDPDRYVATTTWVTAYPPALVEMILAAKGVASLGDELRRDEDPSYTFANLIRPLFAHLPADRLAGARILDFGCGSGASTAVLGRALPDATIVGVELVDDLAAVARARAAHHGLDRVEVLRSPSATELPPGIGPVDLVVLNGVHEHLLPDERAALLPALWATVAPGGHLAITETPMRWWPVDGHTTRLPLVPLLPDRLALAAARRFSPKVRPDETWPDLLRRGIRGATIRSVRAGLAAGGGPTPELLEPRRGDRIDLWYGMGGHHSPLRTAARTTLRTVRRITGVEIVPYLTLVFRRPAA